jgi:hypothetical protein
MIEAIRCAVIGTRTLVTAPGWLDRLVPLGGPMPVEVPRHATILGVRSDHLSFLDSEAERLNLPRSRVLEALLEFALELLSGERLIVDGCLVARDGQGDEVLRRPVMRMTLDSPLFPTGIKVHCVE